MAQNQNGFNRRSTSATRTYPGTATRLSAAAGIATTTTTTTTTPLVDGFSPTSTTRSQPRPAESAPTVFVRPLSRSQLAPVHGGVGGGGGNGGGGLTSTATLLNEPLGRRPAGLAPPIATRPISLETPRPDSERHRNLYLGAPISLTNSGFGGGGHSPLNSNVNPSSHHPKDYSDSSVTAAEQVRLPTSSRKNGGHSDRNSLDVVTSQPGKRTLLDPSSSGEDGGKVKLPESSILCPYCRRCRCEACSTPRPLPSRWICSDTVHCGPEPVLDYVTCLCCVKAVFYHCGKDHEPDGGVMCADKPCSCAPHRKFWRWGCMSAMSLVFPCLCLYWPCKGCIRLTEKAYQKYHSHGCNCSQNQQPHPPHPPQLPPPPPTNIHGRESKSVSGMMLGMSPRVLDRRDSSEDSSSDEEHHHHHLHRPPAHRHVPLSPPKQVIVPRLPTSNTTFLPVRQKK